IADNRSEFEQLTELYTKTQTELKNLESQLNPAIERYEELTRRTVLNTDETEELRRLIVQLSDQWPIAVGEVDAYGNALSINTDILKANIEQHDAYLRKINEVAIKEGEQEKKRKQRYADRLKDEIQSKRTQEFQGGAGTGGGGGAIVDRALSNDELKKKKEVLTQVSEEINVINYSLGLMGVKSKEVNQSAKAVYTFASNASAAMTGGLEEVDKAIEGVKRSLGNKSLPMDAFKEADEWMKKLTKRRAELNKEENESSTTSTKTSSSKGDKKAESEAKREADRLKRTEEKQKEHLANLLKEEGVFSVQQLIDQKATNEAEVAQLELDYQKKIDKFKDFIANTKGLEAEKAIASSKIKELEASRDQGVADLKLKQEKELAESILKVRGDLSARSQTEYDKEAARINNHFDKLQADAGTNATQTAIIEEGRAAALTDAKIREEERLLKVKKAIEDEASAYSTNKWEQKKNEVKQHYDREIALLKERNTKEIQESEAFKEVVKAYEANKADELAQIEKDRRKELISFAIDAAQNIANATFSIISNNIKSESDAKLAAIQEQREKELSQRNLTEKQKQAINEKYDKLEKAEKLRAWKAQKKADLLSATINTALAVTKAIPNWILAAAAGIAGAAQIAVIASQKPPQFAKGGFIPKGSSHVQGGINLIDSRSGAVTGNVEGGEPILSKNTYANNREVVDALLYNSQRRNGAAIQVTPNAIEAERAVRYSGMNSVPGPQNNNTEVNVSGADNSEVVQLLRILVNKKSDVVLSNRLWLDHQEDNIRIENRVNA
ncbi:MAG: hypothetical protein ACTJHT_14125, partial [Sphingobacterium sp.]